jgi:hypothetical protein
MKPVSVGLVAVCAALIAGTGQGLAQTAAPADECIWTNSPAPLKEALTAAATPQEVSTAMGGRLTGETVGAVLTACKLPLDQSGSALLGKALMAHGMKNGALNRLKAKNPEAETIAERLWTTAPQGVRDRFSAIIDPAKQSAATDADFNAQVLAFMDGLKLDNADGQTLYVFLAGRSQIDLIRRTP